MSDKPTHPALAPVIQRIGRALYGRDADVEWIPSDEADVFRLRFEGGLAPRILKLERPDRWVVRREQLAFPPLRAAGLDAFPEVEWTQADLSEDGPAFMVMPETAWRPLPDIWAADRQAAVGVVRRIGDFLSRLRAVDWRTIPGVVPPDLKRQSYREWYTEWLRPLRDHPRMRGSAATAMTEALALLTEEPTGFGGWQGAQVLTDGYTTFTAIDWPNIGAHWPLEDLAGAIVALATWGPDAPTLLRPALVDAWTGGRGLDEPERAELQLWLILWQLQRAASLLRSGADRDVEKAIDEVRTLVERGSAPSDGR